MKTIEVRFPFGHIYKGVHYPAGTWLKVTQQEYDKWRRLGWQVEIRQDRSFTDRTAVPYVTKGPPSN